MRQPKAKPRDGSTSAAMVPPRGTPRLSDAHRRGAFALLEPTGDSLTPCGCSRAHGDTEEKQKRDEGGKTHREIDHHNYQTARHRAISDDQALSEPVRCLARPDGAGHNPRIDERG